MDETINDRIRLLRQRLRLSQRDVATAAGKPREWMVKIENAYSVPSHASTQEALAKGFGVPFVEFRLYLAGDLTLDAAAKLSTTPPQPINHRPMRQLAKAH